MTREPAKSYRGNGQRTVKSEIAQIKFGDYTKVGTTLSLR